MNPELIKQLETAVQSNNALMMAILIISFTIIAALILIIGWFVVRQIKRVDKNENDIENLKDCSIGGNNEIKEGLRSLKENFRHLLDILEMWMNNPEMQKVPLSSIREALQKN